MDFYSVQEDIRCLCKTGNWKKLIDLIDDGSRGMFLILRILTESDGDVTAGDLARAMNVSTARVASALNTLEKKNYVKREAAKDDARKVIIKLTADGENAIKVRLKHINEVVEPMLADFTEEEAKTLIALLKKLLK